MEFLVPWGNFVRKSGDVMTGDLEILGSLNLPSAYPKGLIHCSALVVSTLLQSFSTTQFGNISTTGIVSSGGATFHEPVKVYYDPITPADAHYQAHLTDPMSPMAGIGFFGVTGTPLGAVGVDNPGNLYLMHDVDAAAVFPRKIDDTEGQWNIDGSGPTMSGKGLLMLYALIFG